jgi:RNA polymerase sigma factor (sigma-70 family)
MPANQAIEALIADYYKLVFHTIYALTGNWEESQDLTQDTFHQALKGIDAARAASGAQFHARAWLLRIALNTVRMQQRRQKLFRFIPFSTMKEKRTQMSEEHHERENEIMLQEQAAPLQPSGYGAKPAEDLAETVAEEDAVRRTMAKLPDPLRVCLLLSVVGSLSTAEIAGLLQLKEDAVRQRLVRARKQFKQFYAYESGEQLVEPTGSSASTSTTPQAMGPQEHPHNTLLTTHSPATWRSYV